MVESNENMAPKGTEIMALFVCLEAPRVPAGAAEPVPSVTSEVAVPLRKLLPHVEARPLCTTELEVREGTSC